MRSESRATNTLINRSGRNLRSRWWTALIMALAVIGCAVDAEEPRRVVLADAGPNAPVVQGLAREPIQPAIADTIDLRRIGYSLGPTEAPVHVYEFSDFGCPFCAMFSRGTFPELHDEFIATGKVRWTYIPFVMGNFPNGAESTRSAECAAEQDAFWEMHDLLYEKQNEWKGTRNPTSLFDGYAEQLGLDGRAFAACYRDNSVGDRIALHNRAAVALRVRATPSFFINGRLVEGSIPKEQFRMVLSSLAGDS